MRSVLSTTPLLFAIACGDAIEERSYAGDPFTATTTVATSTTTDECVLSGGRRVSRTVYQVGACVWAAGVIASGEGAINVCCADPMSSTSTVTGPNSDNCQSARTWVERSHQYYFDRCWRSMSCGEINGLLLWFSSKKTLFENLQRWCTAG